MPASTARTARLRSAACAAAGNDRVSSSVMLRAYDTITPFAYRSDIYVTTRHQRSPRRGLHTVFLVPTWRISCAFSTSLTTTVFSQRSRWWFEASPRRAAPKGQPSSPAQHRFHELSYIEPPSTFVAHLQP